MGLYRGRGDRWKRCSGAQTRGRLAPLIAQPGLLDRFYLAHPKTASTALSAPFVQATSLKPPLVGFSEVVVGSWSGHGRVLLSGNSASDQALWMALVGLVRFCPEKRRAKDVQGG